MAHVQIKRSTPYLDSVVRDGAGAPKADMSFGWFIACVPSISLPRIPEGGWLMIAGAGKLAIRHRAGPYVAGVLGNPVYRGLCRAKTIIMV